MFLAILDALLMSDALKVKTIVCEDELLQYWGHLIFGMTTLGGFGGHRMLAGQASFHAWSSSTTTTGAGTLHSGVLWNVLCICVCAPEDQVVWTANPPESSW